MARRREIPEGQAVGPLEIELKRAVEDATDDELGEVVGGFLLAHVFARARPGADPLELAAAIVSGAISRESVSYAINAFAHAETETLANMPLEGVIRRLRRGDTAGAGRVFRKHWRDLEKQVTARSKGGRKRAEKKPEADKPRDDAVIAEAERFRAFGRADREIVSLVEKSIKAHRLKFTDSAGNTVIVKASRPTIARILRDRGFFRSTEETKDS